MISQIERKVLRDPEKINLKMGYRLGTKFGETGIFNLRKLVLVAGGVIGGSFDCLGTSVIRRATQNRPSENFKGKYTNCNKNHNSCLCFSLFNDI
ncbi:hypothetical protein WMZ97_20255 [Lentibacillus sp. N15]